MSDVLPVTLPASHWEGVDAGAEALVDCWLVEAGTRVAAGQPLVRVVLVKTNVDVEAPAAGVVDSVLVPAGETFARGQPLAMLRAAG
jgi:pyruvate/2-oxoglutarate dehydrogenase complex dihydrolipoamide acyltransferase (E2) component